MNRTERSKLAKKFRRAVLYPILMITLLMLVLLVIVDYRVNAALGYNEIKIARIGTDTKENVIFVSVFNQVLIKVNPVYLKRDFGRFQNYVDNKIEKLYSSLIYVLEIIKEYYSKTEYISIIIKS